MVSAWITFFFLLTCVQLLLHLRTNGFQCLKREYPTSVSNSLLASSASVLVTGWLPSNYKPVQQVPHSSKF